MGRYRILVWIALADFFTAFSVVTFSIYISQRARLRQVDTVINVDRQVRSLAEALAGRLRHYGVQVNDPGADLAIQLPEVLLFDSGKFVIKDQSNLAKIALALKDVQHSWNKNFILIVRGHTDSRPPAPNAWFRDNLELSRLRARAVENSLKESGVGPPEFQIMVQGVGESEPIVANCRDNTWIACREPWNFLGPVQLEKNRRIELRFGVFSGNVPNSNAIK